MLNFALGLQTVNLNKTFSASLFFVDENQNLLTDRDSVYWRLVQFGFPEHNVGQL